MDDVAVEASPYPTRCPTAPTVASLSAARMPERRSQIGKSDHRTVGRPWPPAGGRTLGSVAPPVRVTPAFAPPIGPQMPTILLVEDNPDNRAIYLVALEHYGYSVLEAQDGEEAIRLAREEHPDLILMDVSIPKIDGWEATRILKADPATRAIPILALTAHALAADRAKAVEVGCDAYLAKPIEPRRVAEEIERHLSPRDGSDPRLRR